MRMRALLAALLLAACGDDDGGEPAADAATEIDAAPGTPDAPMTLSFDLEPSTVTIEGTQVQVFQLTNITVSGFDLSGGLHYHVYIDDTVGAYLLYDEAIPTSPDVTIPETTPAGTHQIIASIEDSQHDPIGLEASRPLEVVVSSP